MSDEFQMMADEIENDEIIFAERKKSRGARQLAR
jgi:transposase-like protein